MVDTFPEFVRKHPRLVLAVLAASIGLATVLLTPRAPVSLYVATTGTDTGDCRTITAPCARISYALGTARCAPGDTIHVRGGRYQSDPSTVGLGTGDVFSYLTPFCQGSESAWVTITAYEPTPGTYEPVTIRAINYDPEVRYHVWRGIAVEVSGRARNGGYDCIRVASTTHHIRLVDMQCSQSLAPSGMGVGENAHHVEILGTCSPLGVCTCQSHHNGDDVQLDHGAYLSGDDITVDGCAFHDNAAFGLQFWAEGGPVTQRNVLRNSWIFNNGLQSPNGGGVAIGGADDILVANNVIYNNHDGIVTLNGTNFRLIANTVVSNTRYGVEIQNGDNSHRAINNIMWNNADADQVFRVAVDASNNLCRNPTCAVQSDPQFVNASSGDYALQASSPAVGAGLNLAEAGASSDTSDAVGMTRPFPASGAYDIGALEYTPAVSPPIPTPDVVALRCDPQEHPSLPGTWLLCQQVGAK